MNLYLVKAQNPASQNLSSSAVLDYRFMPCFIGSTIDLGDNIENTIKE